MEIMKDTSISSNTINEIMNRMYDLFNQDINKATNSEKVLKNATSEEKNGVVIYNLDNTNEVMFLIHSISNCADDTEIVNNHFVFPQNNREDYLCDCYILLI